MSKITQTRIQTKTRQTAPKTQPTPQKTPQPKQKAGDLRLGEAVNASIAAAPVIKIVDNRTTGDPVFGVGNQNLKENAYTITPSLTANLGKTVGELNNVNLDIGDKLASDSNTATAVISSKVTQQKADANYPYTYVKYIINYHSRNVQGWDLGTFKANVAYNNIDKAVSELRGAASAGATIPYKGVPINIGGKAGRGFNQSSKLSTDFSYSKDFNPKGKKVYFDHYHTVELSVNSSGYAQSVVTSEQKGTERDNVYLVTDFSKDTRYVQNQGSVSRKGEVKTEKAKLFA